MDSVKQEGIGWKSAVFKRAFEREEGNIIRSLAEIQGHRHGAECQEWKWEEKEKLEGWEVRMGRRVVNSDGRNEKDVRKY